MIKSLASIFISEINIKIKMSEIEKEEVEHDDSDEEKEGKPVTKIKSYTDIMKMKLDK